MQDWRISPDHAGLDDYVWCYSKGLKHGPDGLCDRLQYEVFWRAVRDRAPKELEELRPAVHWPRAIENSWHPAASDQLQITVPWADPCSGRNHSDLIDENKGSPWFGSVEMLGDIAEVYWASLCRDIPFDDYAMDSTVDASQVELRAIDKERFLGRPFGASLPRMNEGGYISQFLVKPIPLNGNWLSQRIRCPTPQSNFLTTYDDWITSQNGQRTSSATTYLSDRRYIHNGRSLAEFVRTDFSFQAFLCTGLVLQRWGRQALNPNLPTRKYFSSSAFVRNGWPEITSLVAEVSQLALLDAWYWKWRAFRRLRPEEFAGRAVYSKDRQGYHQIAQRILSLNAVSKSLDLFGTQLLAQSYPEGSPLHPACPSGHAEIAGACVTVLKAFTDPSFVIPAPLQASSDGLALEPVREELSLEGELNKLAWNIAFGRTYAGIHYRSDQMHGLMLGEDVALRMLNKKSAEPGNRIRAQLRKFDGSEIEVPILC